MIYYLISHFISQQHNLSILNFCFSSIIDAFLSKIIDLQNASIIEKAGAAANKASDGCASSPTCKCHIAAASKHILTLKAKSKRILKQGIKLEDQTCRGTRKARSNAVLTRISKIRIRLSESWSWCSFPYLYFNEIIISKYSDHSLMSEGDSQVSTTWGLCPYSMGANCYFFFPLDLFEIILMRFLPPWSEELSTKNKFYL